jgi:SAM-dependent methyltransferase
MGNRYGVEPNSLGVGTSHAILYEMAKSAGSVLDVGCSTGGLAATLLEDRKRVAGVDFDAESVEVARGRGVDAFVADLESTTLSELFPSEKFECVIFGDVLEHLKDPGALLLSSRAMLKPDGFVLVSIPNVSNASVRLALLTNRWDGRDIGLLDRTHLRFFTLDSFLDLAASAGFMMTGIERVVSDARDVNQEHVMAVHGVSLIPEAVVRAAHLGAEANTLQFVMRLEPVDIGEVDQEVARLAAVRARIELRDVLRELEHTRSELGAIRSEFVHIGAQLERVPAARIEELKVRDAMVGMGASLAEARAQVREWEHLRHSDMVAYQELAERFRDVHLSSAWRIGRMVTFPVRALRGAMRRLRSIG